MDTNSLRRKRAGIGKGPVWRVDGRAALELIVTADSQVQIQIRASGEERDAQEKVEPLAACITTRDIWAQSAIQPAPGLAGVYVVLGPRVDIWNLTLSRSSGFVQSTATKPAIIMANALS